MALSKCVFIIIILIYCNLTGMKNVTVNAPTSSFDGVVCYILLLCIGSVNVPFVLYESCMVMY